MKLSLCKGIFMKTVFLHIGLPKTGTTALQSFLRANEAALARSGICFPDLGFRYPNILANRNAHFLIASYDTAPHTASFTPQEEYYTALDQLAALSEEYGKILLSDELIWRICNRHSDFLPTVKQDLASRGMELKVIVYLRRQDEFVQSRYRQRIKTGETFSFYEFLDTLRQNKYPLDFYDSLNKISDAIGRDNLIIRIYEKCQYEGFGHTLCSDFLTIFDLSVSDGFTESERTMNRSLSGTYLEIRRRLNTLPQSIKDTPSLSQSIRETQELNLPSQTSQKQTLFEPGDQKAFLAHFAASNSRLASEYLGRSDGILFYEPLQELPHEQVSQEDLLRDTLLVLGRSLQKVDTKNKELKLQIEKLEKKMEKNCLTHRIKQIGKKLLGRE